MQRDQKVSAVHIDEEIKLLMYKLGRGVVAHMRIRHVVMVEMAVAQPGEFFRTTNVQRN